MRLTLVLCLVLSSTARAQGGEPPKPAAPVPEAAPVPKAAPAEPAAEPEPAALHLPLEYERGTVKVQDHATIDLPDGWQYVQQKDARTVVEKVWGNPPNPSTIGLVIPSATDDPRQWPYAIIVSYQSDGFVKDDDAKGIDYDELLRSMQAETKEANGERKKQGYPTVDLLGWAERPHYDSEGKKLYWARSMRFDGEPATTLNYDVRILGRNGVLVLSAVAGGAQLPEVATGCKAILAQTQFVAGKSYADFDPAYDKVAAYGIGGLIAGKLLLKAGFFKLLVGLWKPIAVGVVALFYFVARLFGARKAATPSTPAPPAA